ncbi:MAG: hypothetical protein GC182_13655 [Rhodopseudomonas sp.]|nr:hypothetical protein [Rhodopseudomonas sp.]
MTTRTLPPACPVCAGPTRIKMTHKLAEPGDIMCIFFCNRCALEYPVAVKAAEANLTGGTDPVTGLD